MILSNTHPTEPSEPLAKNPEGVPLIYLPEYTMARIESINATDKHINIRGQDVPGRRREQEPDHNQVIAAQIQKIIRYIRTYTLTSAIRSSIVWRGSRYFETSSNVGSDGREYLRWYQRGCL
jgi:hypothetical protein